MTNQSSATHVLSHRYPELTTDTVSRYVAHLKDTLGPAKSSAVYSLACRAAPVAENPMGIQRGSVVEISGEKFVVLGCGFMTLELASLARSAEPRTIGKDDFLQLESQGFKVLDPDESAKILEELAAA